MNMKQSCEHQPLPAKDAATPIWRCGLSRVPLLPVDANDDHKYNADISISEVHI